MAAEKEGPATPAEDPNNVQAWDSARLIALIRRGDDQAATEAYRRTFGTDLGRLVLVHFLAECGVGRFQGPASNEDRQYEAGRMDAAVKLMNAAGYDQASAAVMVLTDDLEGSGHERSGNFGHELGDGEFGFG